MCRTYFFSRSHDHYIISFFSNPSKFPFLEFFFSDILCVRNIFSHGHMICLCNTSKKGKITFKSSHQSLCKLSKKGNFSETPINSYISSPKKEIYAFQASHQSLHKQSQKGNLCSPSIPSILI